MVHSETTPTHRRIKIKRALVLVAVVTLGLNIAARAGSIGGNFTTYSIALAATDSAGAAAFAQMNWNNILSPPANFILHDDTGTATTATVTTSPGIASVLLSGSYISGGGAGADERLNMGAAAAGSSATDWSFTLNNIPYASYSLVVYDLSFLDGAVSGITAAGVTFFTSSPNSAGPGYIDDDPATPFTYTQSVSTDPAMPTPLSNYVVFAGLTGTSQTVAISRLSGILPYGAVGGFQIVQTVPEPSTCAMLGLGILGLVGCRRYRRG